MIAGSGDGSGSGGGENKSALVNTRGLKRKEKSGYLEVLPP